MHAPAPLSPDNEYTTNAYILAPRPCLFCPTRTLIRATKAVLTGPSTDCLYQTNLAEVESDKKERLEALRRQTAQKYKEAEEAGNGEFRLHETRNTLDALKAEVKGDACTSREHRDGDARRE